MLRIYDPSLTKNALIEITLNNKKYSNLKVLEAYQYSEGVNVEFEYPNGDYGYWKQSEDGGTYKVMGQYNE